MATTRAGEAPVEVNPADKFCIEKEAYLPESLCWQLLGNYYKDMALEAWAAAVPMFVTSNAKFAKSYARLIFRFICDWFQHPNADHSKKVYILEIGAGHGRFTFLVMRQLLKYEHHWINLGLPARPFVYVFSDVAESNVGTLEAHPMFLEWMQDGWLDFAVFDANCHSNSIFLRHANAELEDGCPIVAIANYVLDSLLTDAFQISNGTDFKRSLLSIYSPNDEPDPTHPDVIARMSLGWAWERFKFNPSDDSCTAGADTATSAENTTSTDGAVGDGAGGVEGGGGCSLKGPPVEVERDAHAQFVLRAYAKMGECLSFTLPVGAFALVQHLRRKSKDKLMLIVGDKGYRDCDEFFGKKWPHIAIHGSLSFMVNLHAIKLYFESLGGFHCSTPYRNTFQVTAYFCCGSKRQFAHSIISFEEESSDMSPTGLLAMQKSLSDTKRAPTINDIVYLLRYSAHDPEVFYNFKEELAQTCVAPFLTPRSEADFCLDMKEVFNNWFKLRPTDGEDLADAMGHMCMKMGKLEDALFFFEASERLCPESRHAATYVNMAACHNALGHIDEAKAVLDKANKLKKDFAPSVELRQQIAMSEHPVSLALLGCGKWLLRENVPLLASNKRVVIKAVYAFDSKDAHMMKKQFKLDAAVVYVGSQGFTALLASPDISGYIVDLPVYLTKSILPLLWENGKHVLTRTPLGVSTAAAEQLLKTYQMWNMYHTGLSDFNDPEANHTINEAVQKRITSQTKGTEPNAAENGDPSTAAGTGNDVGTAATGTGGSTVGAGSRISVVGHPLAWHVAAAVRCETAFLKLASDLKAFGRVLTFSCAHVDDKLPARLADVREALLLDALNCINVGRTILGTTVASVTFKLILEDPNAPKHITNTGGTGTCADNTINNTVANGGGNLPINASIDVESDIDSTGVKARPFLPRLVGHVRFRDTGKGRTGTGTGTDRPASADQSTSILGTLFLCKGAVARDVNYRIVCSDSIVDVVQTGACWKVVTRSHLSKHESDSALQAVGNQATHENWLQQIQTFSGTESFVPWYPTEEGIDNDNLRVLKASVIRQVSTSHHQGLVDTALFDGIVQSVEGGGRTINFVYDSQAKQRTAAGSGVPI